MNGKFKPNIVGGVAGALLAALVGYALLNLNLAAGKKLIHLSYDLLFILRPTHHPDEVRMIYLNDEAHKHLEQPFNRPWDRTFHARLIEKLTAEHARAVVLDIVFSDPGPDRAADDRLARAIRENGRVILAADYTPGGDEQIPTMQLTRPTPLFLESAAGWGVSQLDHRPDFVVRRHYHGPMTLDELTVSESWAAAKLCGVPDAQSPDNRVRERWVNYYGPPGTLPSRGFHQALLPEGVPSGFFSNKVVFVGAYLSTRFSGERKDEFISPFSVTTKAENIAFMPGAEVHATIFLNLLRGDWLTRSTSIPELICSLLVGIAAGFGLIQLRPSMTTFAAPLAALAVGAADYFTFSRFNFWFPWLIPVVQIGVALGWAIVFNSIQLYVQKRLLEQTLSLYLSPKLVKKFSSDPENMQKFLKPGAEKQTLTILFSDIASFTSISEGMDSDDLARSMNRYFQKAVSGCIHSTDGTVVKYIGDAIFAFWNAPEDQPDHQLRACRAALNFRNQEMPSMNGQPLVTRIGLHTGVANVGNFGSTERVDYTALGENINLASRMEGLNKYLGTTVLATSETCAAIKDKIVTRFCGLFRLKGFERAVEVYELIDLIERADATLVWREAFAEALSYFQLKQFSAAKAAFRRILELRPEDGPTRFYLQRLEDLRPEDLPAGWKGDVELKDK